MSRPTQSPLVSIALPVYNGAETLPPVIESVVSQDYPHFELVISDNASTDGTEEICRHFARADERVVYQRHATNVGLLNNFRSAAETARGSHVRWLGDDDALEPDYLSRVLQVFAEDGRRVLVTTQIVYVDSAGVEILHADYDPAAFASADPIERLAEMLRLLTSGFALLDPLYAMMRRDLALLPRRNILREDETFAARLALAGPWGHVPLPLARRHRSEVSTTALVHLLGVPSWHRHAMDVLQCQDLLEWIAGSSLDTAQYRRARAEVLRMYARRKRNQMRRGVAKLERLVSRPARLSPSGAR
jgi:glycosyltransferase involved in cell wall biosynthesis